MVGNETIHFRGYHVLNAIIADLQAKGMSRATEAILAGCSAGGLATYVHCDDFASRFAAGTKVRCVADAGYFPDFKSTNGQYVLRDEYFVIYDMQNMTVGMNQACVQAYGSDARQCFFPQYTVPHLKTPVFALNSGYDVWQTVQDWFRGQSCVV